ncbi:MAG: alpha/beta fold hydrolase [Bacilli bacterium]
MEISIKNRYGDTLYGNGWTIEKPVGLFVIITGMCEASKRYENFAKFLNEKGFSVYSIDHYGQGIGKNGPLGNPGKDYFFKMEDTVQDLIDDLRKKFPHLPVILFGHSMGSFVTQGFLEKYSKMVDKVIICGSNGPTFLFNLGHMAAHLIVHKSNYNKQAKLLESMSIGGYSKAIKNPKSKNDWLSYNEENVKKYDDDKYCGYHCTNGFYLEFMNGLHSIQKKNALKKVSPKLPILIICGEDDPVGNCSKGPIKLNKLYQKCGLDSMIIVYKNMRHEILNENNHEVVYKDIFDFIK